MKCQEKRGAPRSQEEVTVEIPVVVVAENAEELKAAAAKEAPVEVAAPAEEEAVLEETFEENEETPAAE